MLPPTTIFLIILAVFAFAKSQTKSDLCGTKSTCRDCISSPSCSWYFGATNQRCFTESAFHQLLDLYKIYFPENIGIIVQNKALSVSDDDQTSGGNGNKEIIQFQPQEIQLNLRAKQKYTIPLFYGQAEDYPLDLYYLMDSTKSVNHNSEKYYYLADSVAATLKNLSSNYNIGFGSISANRNTSFGFNNRLSLSQNTQIFTQMVKDEASQSSNFQGANVLEAIAQVVSCRDEISWREKARRILLVSTPSDFNFLEVNKTQNFRCQLNREGSYNMSLKQENFSISEINSLLKKNSINIIFAVPGDKLENCMRFTKYIEGSDCTILYLDSSNIQDLIKNQYEKISSTVELKNNASNPVKINFFSKCLNSYGEWIKTTKCEYIKTGDKIQFKMEFEVTECPKNSKDWEQTIKIYNIGARDEVSVNLKMWCDCPCQSGILMESSSMCEN